MPGIPEAGHHGQANFITGKGGFFSEGIMVLTATISDVKGPSTRLGFLNTVVCKIVHKFASVWCKTALGEVGVSLP